MDAPHEDLSSEALTVPPTPPYSHYMQGRPVTLKLKARTLDELREYCGEDGPAAVELAIWTATAKWAKQSATRYAETRAAAMMGGDSARQIKGWPSELSCLDQHEWALINNMAKDAMQGWDGAGRPYLRDKIKQTQRFVGICNSIAADNAARPSMVPVA